MHQHVQTVLVMLISLVKMWQLWNGHPLKVAVTLRAQQELKCVTKTRMNGPGSISDLWAR